MRCAPASNRSSSLQSSQAAAAHDLLRQNIERVVAEFPGDPVRPARMARTSAAHSISSSRVVAKMRPFGLAPHPVPGTADALQRHRDRARRADLADQIHRPDIDAQFERCRCHNRAQFAVLQPCLPLRAAVLRDRLP